MVSASSLSDVAAGQVFALEILQAFSNLHPSCHVAIVHVVLIVSTATSRADAIPDAT